MSELRVVIVDDNSKNRDLIESFLPEYAVGIKSEFGDGAIAKVKVNAAGEVPDLIVINGEDKKGMSLYLFDWIKNKSNDERIESVPVLILIDDEFSDKALDFLEIGDVVFYEGELEEYRFFSAMNEALEFNEFVSDVEEPKFLDEKNFDRISGLSVRPKGDNSSNRRSAVLNMDRQLENLQAALERGKKKSERIKALLDSASQYKENRKKESEDTRPAFLNKIRKEKGLEPVGFGQGLSSGFDDEDDIPEEFRIHPSNKMASTTANADEMRAKMAALHDKIKANPFKAGAAMGMFNAGQGASPSLGNNDIYAGGNVPTQNVNRKTVVVVDDEEKELRTCELFLGQKYNIVALNGGRKAIDYFIRNTADLILVDTYMPSLGGVQTLSSIRWQPNGRNVPAIYMFDKRFPVAIESLSGEGVVGVIQKPLSAGGLAIAVDGFFRNKR